MTGSTVGNNLRSASLRETVIAVGVRRNPVGRQIVTQRQAFIAVATPASGHGDASRVHQRSLLFRPQNQMLPVAVAAHRSRGHAILHCLTMNAFTVGLGDVCVAVPAGCWNIPVVGLGTRIFRGKDSVAPMTIRAACGSPISIDHGSSVHTLPVEFNGMRKRNLMPREELRIAVTGSARVS